MRIEDTTTTHYTALLQNNIRSRFILPHHHPTGKHLFPQFIGILEYSTNKMHHHCKYFWFYTIYLEIGDVFLKRLDAGNEGKCSGLSGDDVRSDRPDRDWNLSDVPGEKILTCFKIFSLLKSLVIFPHTHASRLVCYYALLLPENVISRIPISWTFRFENVRRKCYSNFLLQRCILHIKAESNVDGPF